MHHLATAIFVLAVVLGPAFAALTSPHLRFEQSEREPMLPPVDLAPER